MRFSALPKRWISVTAPHRADAQATRAWVRQMALNRAIDDPEHRKRAFRGERRTGSAGTQILDLKRVKAVADAANVSAHDALPGLVGGVVRRYLIGHNALPKKSILASVPVGLPAPTASPATRRNSRR
ncbi:MAG: hypothetical protein WC809_21320 [Sinimarinibacterium sp.]